MSAVSHGTATLRVPSEAQDEFWQFAAPNWEGTEPAESVGQSAPRKPIPLGATVLCAFCCLALALGLVAQKTQLMTRSDELAALHEELAREQKRQSHLQLELMRARSPQQIDRWARERLGMQEPQRVEYLVLVPAQGDTPSQVELTEPKELGALAAVTKWLTDNWPRWGQAEASHLQ
jgi:cell division protein FtsL